VQNTTAQPAQIQPLNADIGSNYSGDASGGLLIVLGLIGSAGYAIWQMKNGKGDFEDDYHPMSDAPALPTVYTDENLDVIYERQKHPQYQGIKEPNPWGMVQLYPRSQQPTPPPSQTSANQCEPVVQRFSEPVHEPVQPSSSAIGSDGNAGQKEFFESQVLPAPRSGYLLTENDLLTKGKAYYLIWQSIQLGYSKNWIAEHLFKVSKGANSQYRLFSEMYDRIKGKLS
jgi:hypothetical protein